MAMRRCLMKIQNTGLCARSNYTSGLLSKQHPHHHHQLKLHGIRSLSEGPQGSSSLKFGSLQEHSPSSMESEIEKLRVEMKMMNSELLRHVSELEKSVARTQQNWQAELPKVSLSEVHGEVLKFYMKLFACLFPFFVILYIAMRDESDFGPKQKETGIYRI